MRGYFPSNIWFFSGALTKFCYIIRWPGNRGYNWPRFSGSRRLSRKWYDFKIWFSSLNRQMFRMPGKYLFCAFKILVGADLSHKSDQSLSHVAKIIFSSPFSKLFTEYFPKFKYHKNSWAENLDLQKNQWQSFLCSWTSLYHKPLETLFWLSLVTSKLKFLDFST